MQVGGAFADSSATWRWGFYINLVIFAVSAPAMLFTLPSLDLAPQLTLRQRAAQFDWLGVLVFSGWCMTFIMAVNFGGTHYAWDSADEIALWVFTGVLLPAFAVTQWWHPFVAAEFRLYPTQLLRNVRFLVLQLCAFSGAGVTYVRCTWFNSWRADARFRFPSTTSPSSSSLPAARRRSRPPCASCRLSSWSSSSRWPAASS